MPRPPRFQPQRCLSRHFPLGGDLSGRDEEQALRLIALPDEVVARDERHPFQVLEDLGRTAPVRYDLRQHYLDAWTLVRSVTGRGNQCLFSPFQATIQI